MSRPIRIEFPGALYHVTCRGNEKRDIFLSDSDRLCFLALLAETVRRFGWVVSAYVLMSNHFHLLIDLTACTLSDGLQWLNGRYVERFNRRHNRVGHLFQGRPDAPMIEEDTYYLNVARYTVLNPVRANMVHDPADYRWSSFRATIGLESPPEWLAVDRVLRHFSDDPLIAQNRYREFVMSAIGSCDSPWKDLVGQLYLGSPEWIETMRAKIESQPRATEHPIPQRHPDRWNMVDIVDAVATGCGTDPAVVRQSRNGVGREIAAWLACYEGMLKLGPIAAGLRLRSNSRVSALIRECDEQLRTDATLRAKVDQCRDALYGMEKKQRTADLTLSTHGRKNSEQQT